jgi:hypothetical protein
MEEQGNVGQGNEHKVAGSLGLSRLLCPTFPCPHSLAQELTGVALLVWHGLLARDLLVWSTFDT